MKTVFKIIAVLVLLGLIIIFLVPLTIISLVFGFIDLCAKKISGSEEIKKVVEEEKKKIGIPDSATVVIRSVPKYDFSIFGGYGGKTQELGENKHLISLGYTTNRRTIAHEIFHVYRYLAIKDERGLYFYEEFLARIYELFRINLSLKKIREEV